MAAVPALPREVNRAEQTLRMSPVLISEGVTSIREAARAGLGVALLPEWLIQEDLLSGQLVRVLPQWKAKDLPVHVVYAGHRSCRRECAHSWTSPSAT